MPSLNIKNTEATVMASKRGNVTFMLKVMEPDIEDVKMGEQVFYGYPLEHSGEVQALLTPKSFKCTEKFDPYNYSSTSEMDRNLNMDSLNKGSKKDLFKYLVSCLADQDRYPSLNL